MLLTSGGLDHEPIRQSMLDLLGQPVEQSRIVVMVDAYLPFPGDKGGLLDHLARLRQMGWAEFDVLSLLATPAHLAEQRLREADVIYAYGGSNHWLAHAWRSSGLHALLPELLESAVYVGMSAGSMIFSTLHEAAVSALDDQEEVDLFRLDHVALPLFDWFVVTHLGADFFPHQTDEWAAEVAQALGGPCWFLDDHTALLVRDLAAPPVVVGEGRSLFFA